MESLSRYPEPVLEKAQTAGNKIKLFVLESISEDPGNIEIESGVSEMESILEFPGNPEIELPQNIIIFLHLTTIVKY